jgi:hypothetical protein
METVYRLMFLARPLPANPNYSRIPAAFVDAWVVQSDELTVAPFKMNSGKLNDWKIGPSFPGRRLEVCHGRLSGHSQTGIFWTSIPGQPRKRRTSNWQLKSYPPPPQIISLLGKVKCIALDFPPLLRGLPEGQFFYISLPSQVHKRLRNEFNILK